MDDAAAEGGAAGPVGVRARHIRKRALKNKSLSISFNEKDLKDFVTGFHKRKKKRRREALQKQEAAERRKLIELRKKRKLERDLVYGGAPPDSSVNAAGSDEDHEHDEDSEPVVSVSGTMMYDNEDVQVTVTTSEITREEVYPVDKSDVGRIKSIEAFENSKQRTPFSRKKQLKKAPTKKSHPRPQSKRDKKKGKKKNKKH